MDRAAQPSCLARAGHRLFQTDLRRRGGIRISREEETRRRDAREHAGPREKDELRVVPVVDAAEEDVIRPHTDLGRRLRKSRRFGIDAERGHDDEVVGEKRSALEPPSPEERAEIEEPLFVRGREDEVRAREEREESPPVVLEDAASERRRVGEVLDQERIVEIGDEGA